MKNDFLFIENMEIPCRIGTTAEERAFPQVLTVTIHLELPLNQAGKSDSIEATVDYSRLIDDTKRIAQSREFSLVESLAESIAQQALSLPLVDGILVKIGKKVFSGIESVGVSIYRTKKITG